jgi:hypothetical protein
MTLSIDHRGLSRAGNFIRRRAPRHSGRGWLAQPYAASGSFAVRDLSRLGICIEGSSPMRVGQSYSTVLRGPGGSSLVRIEILRCVLERAAALERPVYRIAGTFARPFEEGTLPGE